MFAQYEWMESKMQSSKQCSKRFSALSKAMQQSKNVDGNSVHIQGELR